MKSIDSDRALQIFKDSQALLEGHFELRSGLHSDRYFQCAHVLTYPRFAGELCDGLAHMISEGLGNVESKYVIAPAMGGIVVGHEVARALDLMSIFAEKKDGELYLKRFTIEPGTKYIVAEDVITRGGRVQETIDIVKQGGGIVEAVGVFVNRSGGKVSFDCPLFSLLEMEPVAYEPSDCPMCAKDVPMVHPGS
jgi:orotate phosphoribosyltransferase